MILTLTTKQLESAYNLSRGYNGVVRFEFDLPNMKIYFDNGQYHAFVWRETTDSWWLFGCFEFSV